VLAAIAALGLVVSGELAALAMAATRAEITTAGALLAALGFTVWFGCGILTEDARRAAEQQQDSRR
jgi:hypothetical protein